MSKGFRRHDDRAFGPDDASLAVPQSPKQGDFSHTEDVREQLLIDAFEQAPAFMVVLRGPKLVFEHVNAAYTRLLGRPAEDLIGRPMLEVVPEIAEQHFPELLYRVFETGVSYHTPPEGLPVRLARPDGNGFEERVLGFVYVPLREPDDRITGLLVHGVDLTERFRAERLLRESESRYRALFASIDEGFCIIRMRFEREEPPLGRALDYAVIEANEAFFQHTGFPREIVGKSLREAAPGLDESWYEIYGTVARTRTPMRFENHDANLGRWFNVYAFPIGPEEDLTVAILFSNITERKRMEAKLARRAEALAQANADLLQFASAASHDLKEPLRGISRLASFIVEDDDALSKQSRERLERIRTLCQRLTSMVTGLIQFARMGVPKKGEMGPEADEFADSGRERVRRQPCDLTEVVRRVVDNTAEQLHAENAVVNIRGELPTVPADCDLIERVFANLVANGVKFNRSAEKRVEIYQEPSANPNEITIAVHDNGVGIAPSHQGKIFGLFRRLHSPEQYAGEGLGLALARKIIEMHGGRIELESTGISGEGSIFRIHLPRSIPSSPG